MDPFRRHGALILAMPMRPPRLPAVVRGVRGGEGMGGYFFMFFSDEFPTDSSKSKHSHGESLFFLVKYHRSGVLFYVTMFVERSEKTDDTT